MRLLVMVAALILAVSAPVAGAPSHAGSGGGALLPRVLTVILGLTAAALATRAIRRSHHGPNGRSNHGPNGRHFRPTTPSDPERSRPRRR